MLPLGLLGRETAQRRAKSEASDWTAPVEVPQADRRGADMLVEMFNYVKSGLSLDRPFAHRCNSLTLTSVAGPPASTG